jgi:hypothetical protein
MVISSLGGKSIKVARFCGHTECCLSLVVHPDMFLPVPLPICTTSCTIPLLPSLLVLLSAKCHVFLYFQIISIVKCLLLSVILVLFLKALALLDFPVMRCVLLVCIPMPIYIWKELILSCLFSAWKLILAFYLVGRNRIRYIEYSQCLNKKCRFLNKA